MKRLTLIFILLVVNFLPGLAFPAAGMGGLTTLPPEEETRAQPYVPQTSQPARRLPVDLQDCPPLGPPPI
jgi:hypothetical protein